MILLDTTVLTYAVGSEHALRVPCIRVLETADRLEVSTTVDVLEEFTHVRSRRRTREDAAALARNFAAILHLLVTEPEDLDLGLDLYCRHTALGAFDAILAAVAIRTGAEALVSADRAFGEVHGLPWVDPTSPDLLRILG